MKCISRKIIAALLLISLVLSMTGCDPFDIIIGVLDAAHSVTDTSLDNDHTMEFVNSIWYQYAMIDENGFHDSAHVTENGDIDHDFDNTWWQVQFDTAEHYLILRHYYWGDKDNEKYTSTECETHLFRYEWSNEAEEGPMYEGCENAEWYYWGSYSGPEPYECGLYDDYGNVTDKFSEFYDEENGMWMNTTSENWPYSFNEKDWIRITRIGERLEIAWFRSDETEPYQIRYLYDSASDSLPSMESSADIGA